MTVLAFSLMNVYIAFVVMHYYQNIAIIPSIKLTHPQKHAYTDTESHAHVHKLNLKCGKFTIANTTQRPPWGTTTKTSATQFP
ncbi:unnamed protein product [Ceratitis capitata]|uniref:(Mediterranean fruit fly) hypothetical protein n=1 Tax=Ceratitis capitata TaxID=7213 RepID=A0A811V0B5_CERCA|nr:unnamed protein product [Ceratitis capitata]